jgi:hypothetical protein
MPRSDRFCRFPSQSSFLTVIKYTLGLSGLVLLLAGSHGLAQDQPQAGQPQPSTVTVPAGTRIALVLTHPIQSRHIHRGDDIYAQITSPVLSGDQAVIPPGAFIQGKVDKLERKGGRGEAHLQSLSITFPNGYVAPVSGPVTLESGDGYALRDPGQGRMVGFVALPMPGAGAGALVGHAAASSQGTTITSSIPPGCVGPPPGCLTSSLTVPPNKGKSTVIGAAVGGAIGTVASLVMLGSTHNFYLDVGAPVDMVLQQPLSLEQDQVTDALNRSKTHPVQAVSPPPVAATTTTKGPFDCSAGQEWCNGSCVDTITFINDSSNCGRCGNRCSFSETCTGGSCTCGPGYTSCMGSCKSSASFLSDSSNCGRCGNSCSIGETCMGGTCMRTTPCPPGDITCH